jgi:hypothetical protein
MVLLITGGTGIGQDVALGCSTMSREWRQTPVSETITVRVPLSVLVPHSETVASDSVMGNFCVAIFVTL